MAQKIYIKIIEEDEDGAIKRPLEIEGLIEDGITYNYDGTRLKWLSVAPVCVELYRQGSIKNGKYANKGLVASSETSGVVLPKNATLVGMTIRTRNATATFSFSYEIDNVNQWSDVISATGNYSNNSLNTDLDAGEMGMIYFSGPDDQKDAVCHLFYRWRYTP